MRDRYQGGRGKIPPHAFFPVFRLDDRRKLRKFLPIRRHDNASDDDDDDDDVDVNMTATAAASLSRLQ